MLAQLVYGARPSLLLAVVVVGVSLVIGVVVGLLAGYYLGWVDALVSRTIEMFLVIPLLLAALLMLSLFRNVSLGSGTFNVILLPALVLTMFGWMDTPATSAPACSRPRASTTSRRRGCSARPTGGCCSATCCPMRSVR